MSAVGYKESPYWALWGDLVGLQKRVYPVTSDPGYDEMILGAVRWFSDRWTGSEIELTAKQLAYDLMLHLLSVRDGIQSGGGDEMQPLRESPYWKMWEGLVGFCRGLYPVQPTEDWLSRCYEYLERYGGQHSTSAPADVLGSRLVLDLCYFLTVDYDRLYAQRARGTADGEGLLAS